MLIDEGPLEIGHLAMEREVDLLLGIEETVVSHEGEDKDET